MLFRLVHLMFADPSYVLRRLRFHGFERIIIGYATFNSRIFSIVIRLLRFLNITFRPVDYVRRRQIAERVRRTSPYQDYFINPDDGWAVILPGTFPEVDKITEIAGSLSSRFIDSQLGNISKYRIASLLINPEAISSKSPPNDLRPYPLFQEMAQFSPFVDIATHHIGEVPIIGYVDLQIAYPLEREVLTAPTGDGRRGAMDFHIDRGGHAGKSLKFFIAVDDIDAQNGATQFLDVRSSLALSKEINYKRGRIPEDVMNSPHWTQRLLQPAIPKGGVLILDTFQSVHCGLRVSRRPRITIIIAFYSRFVPGETELQRGRLMFDKGLAKEHLQGQRLFCL